MKHLGSLIDRMKQGLPSQLRHENPYLAEALELEGIILTGADFNIGKATSASENQNLFKKNICSKYAKPDQPLFLEIGCYLGRNVIEFAQANIGLNILGLEITYKRTVKSGRKIKALKLDNARIGICDARDFLQNIPDAELAATCVFFPDPWPKAKHEKNRIFTPEFFANLALKTKPAGWCWIKSDALEYFEHAKKCALENGWHLSDELLPTILEPRPYVTAFQALFQEKNVPTYACVFQKKS